LLFVFCAAVVRVLARGETPDCNCFGNLRSAPVGRGTVVRNGLLLAVAAFVTVAGWRHGGTSAFGWIGDHALVAVAAALFGAVTVAHMAFSWQLFKQNGRLLDRISDLEAGLASDDGLAVGQPGPSFALPDLDGGIVALDDLLATGRGVLLVFTDPACSHCNPLLPALGRAQADSEGLPVAVISTGAVRDNRVKAEEHGLAQVLLQDAFEVAESYHVYGSPGAVLLDEEGRIAAERKGGAKAVAAVLEALATGAPALAVGAYADRGER
jgi:methylamine dehydrogenase accessory protein MauD